MFVLPISEQHLRSILCILDHVLVKAETRFGNY